jgi:multidrug efflux pump
MPQFFIDRPVFAWVLAILIALGGALALLRLPSEAYPAIAPPQVAVTTTYPGASAATVESTVTQVIEQQLTGIDNLLYFTSQSASDGSCTITLTFENGTNPDIAAVQTQNRVSLAEPRLPAEVNQQGIRIAKVAAGFLGGIGLVSAPGGPSAEELNNIVASRVLDPIQRVPGVGAAVQFGSEYAMRIWLDPDKLKAYNLSASAVLAAVQSQNAQFASGSMGAWPALQEQTTTATVTVEGRFTSPEQFEDILLRTEANGASVRLKDVARVTLGAAQYGFETSIGPTPVAAFGIQLAPEANALEVSKAVTERMKSIQGSFPPGVKWVWAWDSTPFIRVAIREVLITLCEAVALVFLVMLVFLQNFRATLIPTLVVPSALLGTLIGMYAVGFSINQLSLFAMVLAIGIVVDDAIVVVEAVDRIMREEHLSPKDATRKAMHQITGAIVAITSVLAAVFIPSALQTGSTGVIYRQFALTIALSMGFSALLALSFTPALCASLLRPEHLHGNVVFDWFNRAFESTRAAYVRRVFQSVGHVPRWMAAFVVMLAVGVLLFIKLPGSFVPDEDQGYALIDVQLPPGANMPRTREVMQHINAIIQSSPDVDHAFLIVGSSFTGTGENAGRAFVHLKPWDERPDTAAQFIHWASATLPREIHDAQVYVLNLPTVRGLGFFGGFDMYLEDRGGLGRAALTDAQEKLLERAAADKRTLSGVRANLLPPSPQVHLAVDRVQAQSMGLSASDVYTALQLMLAPVYANDFIYKGRVLRVLLQADASWRMTPEALRHFYVAGAGGNMIPLANVVHADWIVGPPSLTRFNGYAAVEITGNNAPGRSSGEAMEAMHKIVSADLPGGIANDWAGQSLQELISGAQAPMLFALSILVVYLCLAALYESWSVPAAVLMAVPVGLVGTAVAALLRGLPNDVFFKVGLITIIGLSAKNAILIVEFAVSAQHNGMSLHEGVLQAARLRFRPIIMTSFAFILGVFPMVVSTGAGANARHAIGTGVVGGMLSAAVLGVLMIPVCYVAVRRLMGEKLDEPAPASGAGTVTGPVPRGDA